MKAWPTLPPFRGSHREMSERAAPCQGRWGGADPSWWGADFTSGSPKFLTENPKLAV